MPRDLGSQAASAAWEPAKLAMQETGAWIKNADAKATILAAALSVSVTFAATSLRAASQSWSGLPSDVLRTVVASIGLIALAAVLAAGYNLWRAVFPRTASGGRPNPFSWPDLAAERAQTTPLPAGEAATEEVWRQAKTLAKIAEKKYSSLKAAMGSFAVYILGVGVCAVVLLAS